MNEECLWMALLSIACAIAAIVISLTTRVAMRILAKRVAIYTHALLKIQIIGSAEEAREIATKALTEKP